MITLQILIHIYTYKSTDVCIGRLCSSSEKDYKCGLCEDMTGKAHKCGCTRHAVDMAGTGYKCGCTCHAVDMAGTGYKCGCTRHAVDNVAVPVMQ